MRTIAAVLALAIAGLASIAAQQPQPFRSGIDAVYLDVTVMDRSGAIVEGLTKDDFTIFDEDVEHEVAIFSDEPAPISIGVLIDTSKSMTGERIQAAVRGAAAVGRSLQPKDLWSIFTFSTYLEQVIGWRPYDESVVSRVRKMNVGGSTELFKAVAQMTAKMRDTPHRKRAMLVISDGADIAVQVARSPAGPGGTEHAPAVVDHLPAAERALRTGEVLLYAIGVGPAGGRSGVDEKSLRRLAEPTGGGVAMAKEAEGVELAAGRLAQELRLQYTLGFYPQKAPDGKYRRLRVTAKDPAYRVRTRTGYLATRPK
jgi:Ca-activated chloride channel family protein